MTRMCLKAEGDKFQGEMEAERQNNDDNVAEE